MPIFACFMPFCTCLCLFMLFGAVGLFAVVMHYALLILFRWYIEADEIES